MTETVDAVVVGGGHNGLVAANLLAEAGWEVVVLEGSAAPGGAVRSAELVAPGYLTDLCSAFYPVGYVSPVLRGLHLDEYGLTWTRARDVLAHLLPDGRAAVLHHEPLETAASLDQFAAGDGERWLAAYARWLTMAEQLLDAVLSPFPPIRPTLRLVRKQTLADLLRLAQLAVTSSHRLGKELFDGEGGKLLLAGLALHTDLAPAAAGSGGYGWLLAMLGQQHGFPVPVGGAQQITEALLSRLARHGGAVRGNAMVDRIIVRAGKALGVGCTDGTLVRARKAVLCDVPAPMLYRHLVDAGQLPERLLTDLRGFCWDFGTIKIDWALSEPVPWTTGTVREAGTLHLGVDLDGLARHAADLSVGVLPSEPFVIAGQMARADPTRAPSGTESLWAYSQVPQRAVWDDHDLDQQVRRIESIFERQAPGFQDLVVGRHVSRPPALQAKNPSLLNGAVNGGTAAPHQQLIFRPLPGLGRADTPIDRLYLASASAHPGGGVHGAPGANAARAALARHRPFSGGLYGTTVQAVYRRLMASPGQR